MGQIHPDSNIFSPLLFMDIIVKNWNETADIYFFVVFRQTSCDDKES